MAVNRLKVDAIALVAATQSNDVGWINTILERNGDTDSTLGLLRAVSDVAALLAGSGASRSAITGYLDFIGASNGKKG